ncbi:heat shock protein Hsp20 [Piromyces finnis]|uniref:Heat shock protein Hsp20 n=1 Tax=Piromyces finnis TaxID=1754191 RepID=A0A1Y1VMP1_9FUNG|nr:heat shock protein Hsp20 [Piromyces finnis]|eukprot:ORX60205.1 heat shock protein Hsp20 [Piromyces finnis]
MYPFHYYQHRKNNRLQNDNINSLEKKLVDFSPSINLTEDENNYYIHADLPGMRKDQIKMEITDDHTFTISGERESFFDNEKEKKIHVIECSYGKFERSFTIPEDADLNNIQAKMENGVLEVLFNKIEHHNNRKRTIPIQ